MSTHPHPDAERIIHRLRQENVQSLYHFTSVENLPSIRELGAVCSKQTLEGAGRWPPPEPGGNELSHHLDRSFGNWDKLSVNLTPNTPMAYRKKRESHLCFFVLEIDVAARLGVLFTNTNAAAGIQERQPGLQGLGLVDFNAVRSTPRPWDRDGWLRPVQAEVLIPGSVPLSSVIEVTFVSQASLEEAGRLWGAAAHPHFRVDPRHFADLPHLSSPSMGFPQLVSILLTDVEVNSSNCMVPRIHKPVLHQSIGGRVTVLANVAALAGTRAAVTWNPGDHLDETEFEKSADYWHWPSIEMKGLPDGLCFVEYRLDKLRWATINFELES